MIKYFLIILTALVFFGCAHQGDTVTQISTIDALLAGHYDGAETLDEMKTYGDFGIGTFDRLEGEMIVLNGRVYQAKADGKIYEPEKMTTPFASVSFFKADNTADVTEPADYAGLIKTADSMAQDKNIFCALKAEGVFSVMKVRSVPAQNKPYLPLAEVVKTQSVYEYQNIEGTIVGYRLPEYIKGLNVGGYHLHFIDKDKKVGGHILGFTMIRGKVSVDEQNRLFLILPKEGLKDLDLTKDRAEELERVEK
ncbi:MAG: acetolactate decarboxylase [Deferribacterales bacterium]